MNRLFSYDNKKLSGADVDSDNVAVDDKLLEFYKAIDARMERFGVPPSLRPALSHKFGISDITIETDDPVSIAKTIKTLSDKAKQQSNLAHAIVFEACGKLESALVDASKRMITINNVHHYSNYNRMQFANRSPELTLKALEDVITDMTYAMEGKQQSGDKPSHSSYATLMKMLKKPSEVVSPDSVAVDSDGKATFVG